MVNFLVSKTSEFSITNICKFSYSRLNQFFCVGSCGIPDVMKLVIVFMSEIGHFQVSKMSEIRLFSV